MSRNKKNEKWHKEQRKENVNDQSKQIVKTAAKLLMGAIKTFGHSTSTYPPTDDIRDI